MKGIGWLFLMKWCLHPGRCNKVSSPTTCVLLADILLVVCNTSIIRSVTMAAWCFHVMSCYFNTWGLRERISTLWLLLQQHNYILWCISRDPYWNVLRKIITFSISPSNKVCVCITHLQVLLQPWREHCSSKDWPLIRAWINTTVYTKYIRPVHSKSFVDEHTIIIGLCN